MTREDLVLHLLLLVILLALGGIRLWYYRLQRRGMGMMALKKQEMVNELRQIGAMLAFALMVVHMLTPNLFAWMEFPLAAPVRWIGAALAVLGVGASWFAARDELLVAQRAWRGRFDPPGLFRWVRHPLELVVVVIALALTLLSASWVVALLGGALAAHEVFVRAPRVDRERRARLGETYEAYARVTPAFIPRLRRSPLSDARGKD